MIMVTNESLSKEISLILEWEIASVLIRIEERKKDLVQNSA